METRCRKTQRQSIFFASPVPLSFRKLRENGVDGEDTLFLAPYREVLAVAGLAPLEEFRGDLAESRMGDLEWVGPRVCRHEQVVEKIMRHSPVLPARFGTIFLSVESLENRMRMHRDAIGAFLDRVSDMEEWSVKGFLNREKAAKKQYRGMLAGQAGTSFPSARHPLSRAAAHPGRRRE